MRKSFEKGAQMKEKRALRRCHAKSHLEAIGVEFKTIDTGVEIRLGQLLASHQMAPYADIFIKQQKPVSWCGSTITIKGAKEKDVKAIAQCLVNGCREKDLYLYNVLQKSQPAFYPQKALAGMKPRAS